ncbi:MAG: CinA family protein [Anaerolineae bacterium]
MSFESSWADGIAAAREVLDEARRRNVLCATAESCTGGLVGALLTAIPGSSDAYAGGVIAYSNDVKSSVLGVTTDSLQRYGAVSEEVAVAMATGVARAVGADVAVSVTGVAGPGGGTPDKPVGLVCFAAVSPVGARSERMRFAGDRAAVRAAAAIHALVLMASALREMSC